CSAGFLAKANNESKSYIVTAKHCGDNNTKFFYGAWDKERTNELIGSMSPIEFDNYDFGLTDISNMSDSLTSIPAIRNSDSEQYRLLPFNDGIPVSNH
ncbi:2799_t:CDS:1, partial [Gigaspora rosea]